MAIDRDHIISRGPFLKSRRRFWIVGSTGAGRRLFLAGIGRLNQGDTKRQLGGSDLLRLRGRRRQPAIGRIDDQRRARTGALERHELRIIGAGDVARGPLLRPFVGIGEHLRPGLIQCGALGRRKKLLVCVSCGPLQWRVGFVGPNTLEIGFAPGRLQRCGRCRAGAVWLAAIVGTKASAGMIASEIPMDVRRRVRMSCLPLPAPDGGPSSPHVARSKINFCLS